MYGHMSQEWITVYEHDQDHDDDDDDETMQH